MKVLLFGKAAKNIEKLVKSLGFEIVSKNPEVIITYGGDGTLLSSEREYPGIPKLPIRNDSVCKKCSNHKTVSVLEKILKHSLRLKEYQKLQTNFAGNAFFALNDFVIRNNDPVHTIRFRVNDGKLLIGDGIVISTAFGSTGYFKSITQKSFDNGFGVAFNNTTEKKDPIFLEKSDQIQFNLIRGEAVFIFDNNPQIFKIKEGAMLTCKLSNHVAKIYEADSLRCPDCEVIRG